MHAELLMPHTPEEGWGAKKREAQLHAFNSLPAMKASSGSTSSSAPPSVRPTPPAAVSSSCACAHHSHISHPIRSYSSTTLLLPCPRRHHLASTSQEGPCRAPKTHFQRHLQEAMNK
jgi:hypothetical protein